MKNAKNVILLGVTAIVMIVILGYLVVVSPLLVKMEAGRVEYQDAQSALAASQTRANGLEIYRTQAPEIEAINNELAAQFPTTADVSGLNAQVVSAATSAGLSPDAVGSISTTTPTVIASAGAPAPVPAAEAVPDVEGASPPIDDTGATTSDGTVDPAAPAVTPVASMEVTISATGSIDALIRFARNLGEMDRVLLITDQAISNEGNEATISIKAQSYLYQPILSPAQAATDNEADASTEE